MGVAGLVAGGPTHVAGSTGLHGYPVASNPLPDLTRLPHLLTKLTVHNKQAKVH